MRITRLAGFLVLFCFNLPRGPVCRTGPWKSASRGSCGWQDGGGPPGPDRPNLGHLLLEGAAAVYVGNWTNLGHGTLILVPLVQIVAAVVIERASQREER